MKVLIKGTLAGGVIAFIWCIISWMVIPWHAIAYNSFKSESSVQTVLQRNVDEPGIYLMPSIEEMDKKSEEPSDARHRGNGASKQIFIFAAIDPHMTQGFSPVTFIISLASLFVIAFFVTALTKATRIVHYFSRLIFIGGIAFTGGLMIYLPLWNWMHFSPMYVALHLIDHVITWLLAGIAIAGVTRRTPHVVGLQ